MNPIYDFFVGWIGLVELNYNSDLNSLSLSLSLLLPRRRCTVEIKNGWLSILYVPEMKRQSSASLSENNSNQQIAIDW